MISTAPEVSAPNGVTVLGPMHPQYDEVLTPEALEFTAGLTRRFRGRVHELLVDRRRRQARYDQGARPDFPPDTRWIRTGDWTIAPLPDDLVDPGVEIIGPADRETIDEALTCGAGVFTADFDDATSPTWSNVIEGQAGLREYRPGEGRPVLMVRPRGWHLFERHVLVDGRPVPAALFDFGMHVFHNGPRLAAEGRGPYFCLPKLEGRLEARLWNDVFRHAQVALGIPRGTIRATVVIETLPAAFEMEEILYELREHSAGLKCGHWNYVSSFMKTFRSHPGCVLPDREQVTMSQPCMRAYAQLLARTCHRRGAPAGTFDPQAPGPDGADLCRMPEGTRTERGLRRTVRAGLQCLEGWLCGRGRVALDGEGVKDAATAELSRTQVWQWIRRRASLDDGRVVTPELVAWILDDELAGLRESMGDEAFEAGRFGEARALFQRLVTAPTCQGFLTLSAYEQLLTVNGSPHERGGAERWSGIVRPYGAEEVDRRRGSLRVSHTLAERGAARLWEMLCHDEYVAALGAVTGDHAVQQVRAGLSAVHVGTPGGVRRVNRALRRADQAERSGGWYIPIVADGETGLGGPSSIFELTQVLIEAGAAGVHLADRCGHLGGDVLVPTCHFIRILVAARLAADVLDVPTVLIARTDARDARLLTCDVDPVDRPFRLEGARTGDGLVPIRGGLDLAIARSLAYAPYADLLCCGTDAPDLDEARRFAEAIHAEYPGKMLAYDCSPSFNWKRHLDERSITRFQRELAAMGYKFQFVPRAGVHSLNHAMYRLARAYRTEGVAACARLQQCELADAADGYAVGTVGDQRSSIGIGQAGDYATLPYPSERDMRE